MSAKKAIKRKPVSREMFGRIADYYGYDRSLPLEAKIIDVWPHRVPYIIEKVTFASTHGDLIIE